MRIKIEHIKREHDRLIRENSVHGYMDVVMNGARVDKAKGIATIDNDRYEAIAKWKSHRMLGLTPPPPPPAKTGKKKNTAPRTPRTPMKESGPRLWGILHSRKMVDQASELAWLDWFSGQVECGDCRRHWLQLLKEMPPDLSSQESYDAWKVRAHNAVNRRIGKAEWMPSVPATTAVPDTDAPLVFHLGSTGLGDAICGLYAACGLADSTGRKVIYYAHSSTWIKRASHPNVEIRARITGDMGANPCKDMRDYGEQINGAETRVKFYAAKLAEQLGVNPFEGKRPQFVDTSTKA